jgi:hypothetical protein
VAIVLALVSLIALRPTNAPQLSADPTAFDAGRAYLDLRELAERYPNRTVGSAAGNHSATWIADQLEAAGLQPNIEPFQASIDGNDTALQNVWAISGPRSVGTIVLSAARDTSSVDREGANANASGASAVIELARVYSVQRHTHSIVFLWTEGDMYGAIGTKAFLEQHPELDVVSALNLDKIATPDPTKVELDGWSAGTNVAPPWLWAAAQSAGKAEAKLPTPLPNIVTQTLHLAVPVGGGSQGAFLERGIPALTMTVAGREVEPVDDTVENTQRSTLGRAGRMAERLIDTLDAQADDLQRAGAGLFFSRYRQLSGAALRFALTVLLLPLVVIGVDMLAASRRRKASLGPAWLLYAVRFAPWLVMLIVVYFANLVGALPGSPGPAIPPDAVVAQSPRYFRMLVLAAILVAVVYYAHVVERFLQRRNPVAVESTVTVVHVVLLAIALLVLVVNPFSLFLLLPAAALWPLARRGPWVVSRLPAWGGLIGLGIALIYFGLRLGLGFKVWWYFFLMLEDRIIPAAAAILGAAFIAGALHLGHHLHRPVRRRPLMPARRGALADAAGTGSVSEGPAAAGSGPEPLWGDDGRAPLEPGEAEGDTAAKRSAARGRKRKERGSSPNH